MGLPRVCLFVVSGAKLSRLKATLVEQMRVKRDEALARRYELFGERYGGDHAKRLEEDELEKVEEAELTDQTDTDEESDEESELDMEERAVMESQRQVGTFVYLLRNLHCEP